MTDIKKVFEFKSQQPYYDKEKYGLKNNTVRHIDLNDKRYIDLIHWSRIGWRNGGIKIKIVCAEEPKDFFTRDIRDISIYNNLMIITWNREEI